MMIVSHLIRWRRTLALCATSLLLHALFFAWSGTPAGPLAAQRQDVKVVTIRAQLHAAPDPVSQAVSVTPPKALPKRRTQPVPQPKRDAAPEPTPTSVLAPSSALAAQGNAVATAAADVGVGTVPAGSTGSTGSAGPSKPSSVSPVPAAAVSADPTDPTDPTGLAQAERKSAEPAPRYKVNLPPSARLALDVTRTDADGTVWQGVGEMNWRHDGARYTMSVKAGLSLLFTHLNLLVLTSEGIVDEAGIAPVQTTEQRRGRAQTATHFRRDEARITFSASDASVALAPGTQDKATLPMQLAAIARGDPRQLEHDIDILVGEERVASLFRFVVRGQEQLDTPLGLLATWHLSRPPRPGSYHSTLDVWLAPGFDWYPVQIRNTENNGAITTQSVRKINHMEAE